MQDDTKQIVPEEETIAKYTIKDSVFSDLFKIKKYLLQLYRALHPEDKTATESELLIRILYQECFFDHLCKLHTVRVLAFLLSCSCIDFDWYAQNNHDMSAQDIATL